MLQNTITSPKKVLIICLIGNALEFYNFTLCGVFIHLLGRLYFPSDNDFLVLLGGMFAFSAAFWTRPLGAILFGYIGDRMGRKKALVFSILLMGVPTLGIVCLPTYESIGLAASILLVFFRLAQGLSTGGEYNGTAIFTLEHLNVKPGFISGLISASCVVGAITATCAAYLVTKYMPYQQSWRLPFLFGVSIIFVGFLLQKYSGETNDFKKKRIIHAIPLLEVIKNYPKQYITSISLGAFNGILSYTLFGFLNIYLSRHLQIQTANSLLFSILGLCAFMMSCPLFGYLSDKITPYYSMLLSPIIAIITSWIGFSVIQLTTPQSIIFGQLLIGIGVGSFVGPSHAFLQQQFSPEVRYTGIATGFSLGIAIAGGTTGICMTYLLHITHNLMVPAIYISFAAIGWIVILKLLKTNIKLGAEVAKD